MDNSAFLLNAIFECAEFEEWLTHQLTSEDFITGIAIRGCNCNWRGFNPDIANDLERELETEQAYDDALKVVKKILGTFSDDKLRQFLNELKGDDYLDALDLSDYAGCFEDLFIPWLAACVQYEKSKLVSLFENYIDCYVEDCINDPEKMCGPQRRAWDKLRKDLIYSFERDIDELDTNFNYDFVRLLNSLDGRFSDDARDYFDNVYTKIYDEIAQHLTTLNKGGGPCMLHGSY